MDTSDLALGQPAQAKFSYPSFEQLHFSLVLTTPGIADLALG